MLLLEVTGDEHTDDDCRDDDGKTRDALHVILSYGDGGVSPPSA
jgi:hypothetical protein